jgi:hypothetical protein
LDEENKWDDDDDEFGGMWSINFEKFFNFLWFLILKKQDLPVFASEIKNMK